MQLTTHELPLWPGDELGGGGSVLPMRKMEERRPINWMRTIGERCSCLSMDADPRLPKGQPQSAAQGVTPWALPLFKTELDRIKGTIHRWIFADDP